jgi:hypothetical protein
MSFMAATLILCLGAAAPADWEPVSSSVGSAAHVAALVLPGTLLEVADVSLATPVILRIASASPHGSMWRYDLEWYGLEPGQHDLALLLRREDGSSVGDLPALPVEIVSALAADDVLPREPDVGELPSVGGYSTWMIVGGALWLVGLIVLIAAGRRRRACLLPPPVGPLTVAERLKPLVRMAIEGRLERAAQAQLELALITYWRRRLDLQGDAAEAVIHLRSHAEAGPLLSALENWLHRPEPPAEVDLATLLEPYRDLPVEALSEPLPLGAG